MFKLRFFNNLKKKKITLIALLIIVPLLIVGTNNNWVNEVIKLPAAKTYLVNIAKVVVPLKNLILMRNLDDQIASLKSSRSCMFCNLTQGDLQDSDLRGIDLRYATLTETNLTNANLSRARLSDVNLNGASLSGADLSNVDLTRANLSNSDLTGTVLDYTNLTGAYLEGVNLTQSNLIGVDFTGANLSGVNFTQSNLSGVNLSNQDLTGTILTYANFTRASLNGADLSGKDLTGTILTYANLTGANLDGVDLSNKNLTGVNLSGVDLSNKDLTGTILTYANLTGANLDGVDLSNKNLTGVNLSGVDLSGKDLTGTILEHTKQIEISVKNPSNSNWPSKALKEFQNLNVSRYDLSGDKQYLATKEGFLFEWQNDESKLVLNLNNDAQFPFVYDDTEQGLLGIASHKELVYIAYSSPDINGLYSLVVDEYSMNFSKARNIIKIGGFSHHYGGNLLFDGLGKLYLSVGDGGDSSQAQDLSSLKGKILRLDVSQSKREPEIVAYGIRNAWGGTIDSRNRMFIVQCGGDIIEAIYLLDDLYSGIPVNLGWPVFEGSIKLGKEPLRFKDVLTPIFETNIRPGCLTAGVYLDDIDSFVFADFYGTIRLLKQQENSEWYLVHEYKQETGSIWSFGLDENTQSILIAPRNLELEILVDQAKFNQ